MKRLGKCTARVVEAELPGGLGISGKVCRWRLCMIFTDEARRTTRVIIRIHLEWAVLMIAQ
jgi:hypothetical protein